ncbi:hypothetical protein GDO81_006532 [Engystomops pustulosus]|uniref:Uncharacterized protein n=2 Tax=Engystomops pustulosus TaxID=76066 RepID=A0AAV7D0L2_ENGPU|nr:hypothetical protein GDO81_006532 [Engystomops pustulosus]
MQMFTACCPSTSPLQGREEMSVQGQGTQFEPGCSVCAQWKELILSHHNNRNGEIYWGNSDPSMWPTHYWEVAKVYMPRGQTQYKRPKQSDATALLNLLNNCNYFNIQNTSRVREIIRCRNELMHSFNMKVSSTWLEAFGQKMHDLISEFTHVPGLVKEGEKMQEVLLSDWKVEDLGICDVDGILQRESRFELQSATSYTRLLPYDVERRMIEQMIQELSLEIVERGSLTKEDEEKVCKIRNFLAQNEDLRIVFQEDLQWLDCLSKNNFAPNAERIPTEKFARYFLVCSMVILAAFIVGEIY